MNLPPTIQKLVAENSDIEDFDIVWFAQAVAHAACRLQHEADVDEVGLLIHAPIVVPAPEGT